MKGLSHGSNSSSMALADLAEKELRRIEFKKPKDLLLPAPNLASVEALSLPLVQEVILSVDIQCAECEKRLDDIMSRVGETESVVVNLMEKKVTLTSRDRQIVNVPARQVAARSRNPLGKVAVFKWIFRPSCS